MEQITGNNANKYVNYWKLMDIDAKQRNMMGNSKNATTNIEGNAKPHNIAAHAWTKWKTNRTFSYSQFPRLHPHPQPVRIPIPSSIHNPAIPDPVQICNMSMGVLECALMHRGQKFQM